MAKKKSVNSYPLNYVANQLNQIVADMFTEYGEDIAETVDKVTEQVAKDFAEHLKDVTPRSNADVDQHMADTVTVTKKRQKLRGRVSNVYYVHYGKWQIAHLLEFGYTLRSGERLSRTPFIRPLFDNNKARYYNMYKEALKKND